MFKVIHPQPKDDDISFWELKEYSDLGMGIARNDDGLGFIPFPADEDPTGVKVFKRNHMWFWVRPRYYNLSCPVTDARATLVPLKIFSDYQMKLIASSLNYADNDPAGLDSHQSSLLVANLYTLLALALASQSENQIIDLVETFHSITGGDRESYTD